MRTHKCGRVPSLCIILVLSAVHHVFLQVGMNFHKLRFGGKTTTYHNYRSLAEAQSNSVRSNSPFHGYLCSFALQ